MTKTKAEAEATVKPVQGNSAHKGPVRGKVVAVRGSVLLGFDLCSDSNGKPLCACACAGDSGFRCRALRPKTFNARGDLVHYCGLGEPVQLPLITGSVKHGIVRPRKNQCWLRHDAPRGGESITRGTQPEKTPDTATAKALADKTSTLHALAYVMDTHVYVDTRDFSTAFTRINITAMESDMEAVRHTLNTNKVQSDIRCLIRELCTLSDPYYSRWQELRFHVTELELEPSGLMIRALRITHAKTWNACLFKSHCETHAGLSYRCVVLSSGRIRVQAIRK